MFRLVSGGNNIVKITLILLRIWVGECVDVDVRMRGGVVGFKAMRSQEGGVIMGAFGLVPPSKPAE